MTAPLPISVVVVAKNEAHNLARCLASVQGWVAEILVVLNDTTDASESIALATGARVTHPPWQGYRDTKNAALALAQHDWVLSLDADEEVSPALRADLVAFLKLAMAPGGDKRVVDQGLLPVAFARGPRPDPLATAPDKMRVTAIRHCGDSYFITTADGVTTPFWEMNVRLKLDTRDTGPAPGKPVVAQAGMQGDRVTVIFSSVEEIKRFVEEKC